MSEKLINYEEAEKFLKTAEKIKNTLEEYYKKTNKSTCDKYGCGFNLDSRYSAIKFELSLDSWTGYYGNSSCSSQVEIGDRTIFLKYFIETLNRNIDNLLLETADKIKNQAVSLKKRAIEELKTILKKYEEL